MRRVKKKSKFLKNSIGRKVKNSLVPTDENDYSPKVLGFKSLSAIVVFLVLFKIFVTLFLFAIYPRFVYLSADIYNQVLELTNSTRVESGVSRLQANSVLDEAARAKAQDMFLRQYFSHDTPDGKKPWHWINKTDYDYVNAGENLAMNFTSAEVAHLAFLQSPSHKKNIVNPKFKDIGIAVLTGEMNGKKTMIMVEMFGRAREAGQEIKKSRNQEIIEIQKQDLADSRVAVVQGAEDEDVEIVREEEIKKSIDQEIEEAKIQKHPASAEATDGARENNETQKHGEEYQEIEKLRNGEINELIDQEDEAEILMVSLVDPDVSEVSVRSSILRSKSNLINNLLKYLDYILYSGLIFIVVILFLNILIKIRIQRPAVIFQSMLTIGIIIILIISKLHFVQNLAARVIVG